MMKLKFKDKEVEAPIFQTYQEVKNAFKKNFSLNNDEFNKLLLFYYDSDGDQIALQFETDYLLFIVDESMKEKILEGEISKNDDDELDKIKIIDENKIDKNNDLNNNKSNNLIENNSCYDTNNKDKDKENNVLKTDSEQNGLVSVKYIFNDPNINLSLEYNDDDIFELLKEKLVKQYPEYKDKNNHFSIKGKKILEFKKKDKNEIMEIPITLII